MFSFFRKASGVAVTDRVWKTKEGAFKGAVLAAVQKSKEARQPVVFFFFEETGRMFRDFLDATGIAYSTASNVISGILVADAFQNAPAVKNAAVFFLDHYPVPAVENAVFEKLSALIANEKPVFCLSLEDSLLRQFGSDRIATLMETLGMKDEEAIEHEMVSKAILSARKKFVEKAISDIRTKSESEYYKVNI